jgi:hypothetical protein
MSRYWENETPEVIKTERNMIKYYPNAGKMQVAGVYKDAVTGEVKQGKTATLDIEDAAAYSEALDLIQSFIDASRELVATTEGGD